VEVLICEGCYSWRNKEGLESIKLSLKVEEMSNRPTVQCLAILSMSLENGP
jgi:hypothetical protein